MGTGTSQSALWQGDEELFGLIRRELYTAVIGDILDEIGLRHQFLPPEIRALSPQMKVVGRALPVLEADTFDEAKQPFGLMFEALDDLAPGEVYLVAGASPRYSVWGELMTIAAKQRGSAGVVAQGYVRDTRALLDLDFPVFSLGSYAQDQRCRGQVIDFRVPVEVGQVRIAPGDLIVGDIDGVLSVPGDAVEAVITQALDKVRGERQVKGALLSGMSAVEAFRRYGIM